MAAVNPIDFASRMATALEKVKTAIEEADRQLAVFKGANEVSDDVLQELQTKAQSGELGADIQAAVRTKLLEGAAVFAIILMIFGAMSKYPAMTVLCLAAGLLGITLVVLALKRRWPIGRQWLVGIAVWAVDVSLIIVTWKLGK